MYCKNCGKSIKESDNFCSGCGIKVDIDINELKDSLNKQYNTKSFYSHNVVRYNLIDAKFVKIKKIRKCEDCKKKILPNELALTSSKRECGYNIRIWRCVRCGKSIIDMVNEVDSEETILNEVEDQF